MKLQFSLILFIALISVTASNAFSQAGGAAQTAAELRAKLSDVQAKEAGLQDRARQLDEELKPENIERSLAGVGSTKPEELRELRRRQLTIEKEGVNAQLKILASSRERLEAVVRTAEGEAYQQSADGASNQSLRGREGINPVGLALMLVGILAIFGTLVMMGVIRKVGIPAKRVNK